MKKFTKLIFLFFQLFQNSYESVINSLSKTKDFQGLFARGISSDQAYIGNLYEDVIINTTDNSLIKKVRGKSNCFLGSACPGLVLSDNKDPLYLISKNDSYFQLQTVYQNPQPSPNIFFFENTINIRKVLPINETHVVLVHKLSTSGYSTNIVVIFNFIQREQISYTLSQSSHIGIIKIKNTELFLVISKYAYMYYYVFDNNLKTVGNSQYYGLDGCNFETQTGIYLLVELKESTVVFCGKTTSENAILCCAGVYSLKKNGNVPTQLNFSVKVNGKNILTNCYRDGEFRSFSFGALTDERAVASCGTTDLQITKIGKDLEADGPVIKVTNAEFFDFTILDFNKIYIVKSSINSGYEYLGEEFEYPYCEDETIIIFPYNKLSFTDIMLKTKNPTLASATKIIKFAETPKTERIFYNYGSPLKDFTKTHKLNTLYFLSETSETFEFTYYALNEIFGFSYQYPKLCRLSLVVCHPFCGKCLYPATIDDQNCQECDNDKGLYRMDGDIRKNCYNETNIPDKYYLNTKEKLYKKCHQNCLKCTELGNDDDTKCTKCDINSGFLPVEGKESLCVKEYNHDGYYKDSLMHKKCHESCKTCKAGLMGTIHNCEKCADEYVPHPYLESNCVKDCGKKKWYIGKGLSYNCLEEDYCSGFYPILVEETNQCVNDCMDLYTCEYCIEHSPLYEYNGKCVPSCPNGIDYGSKCNQLVRRGWTPTTSGGNIEYISNSDITYKEFSNMTNQALDLAYDNMKNDGKNTMIEGKDYSYEFYPSGEKESSSGSDTVKLGDCEKILRDFYQLEDSQKLFISQFSRESSLKNSAANSLQYDVYAEINGQLTKLDLSICDDTEIKIIKSIKEDKANLELAKDLMEQGIDIFDENESIFNDECSSFSIEGHDLTIEERRKQIYSSSVFCPEEGCSVEKIDYDTYEAECSCVPNSEGIGSLLEENEIISMFTELFKSTNLFFFKCVQVFGKNFSKELKDNIGNWIMISSIIAEVTFIVFFVKFQILSIFSFLNKYINCPICKKKQNDIIVLSSSNKSEIATSIDEIKNFSKSTEEFNPVNKRSSIAKSKNFCFSEKLEDIKSEGENCEEEADEEELNGMPLEEALKNDKRNIFSYYLSIIAEKQIILMAILNKSIFYPLTLRLIFLLFTICSFLFLNALFFTSEYIEERNQSKNSGNIWYILKNELSKSVYASLIGMVISKVLIMATSSGERLMKLIKEERQPNFVNSFKTTVFQLKKRYYIVFSVILFLIVAYWYFIFIFCSIYKNNQLGWLQSSFISIFINILIPLVVCIFIAFFRYLGMRCKNNFIFNISLCIYETI